MDYGRNKKIHGFSKKSHNCNPCAQHSNTYPRGLKLKRERGNPSKVPPSRSPFLAVGGSADNKIWEQLQNTTLSSGVFSCELGAHRRVSRLTAATRFSLLRHISRSYNKEMGETDEI